MGRHHNNSVYVTPYSAAGTEQVATATEFGRGAFTLTAATTYMFPLAAQDVSVLGVHLQHDAAIAITSATIEVSDLPPQETSDFSDNPGEWFGLAPTTAYVPVDGATTTATNGVVAVVAGNIGGAHWDIADIGARRARLKIVVGATRGEVRVGTWGKE